MVWVRSTQTEAPAGPISRFHEKKIQQCEQYVSTKNPCKCACTSLEIHSLSTIYFEFITFTSTSLPMRAFYNSEPRTGPSWFVSHVYLTGVPRSYENATPPRTPPRTLGTALRKGPRMVRFLMSEVPLYSISHDCHTQASHSRDVP